MDAPIAEEMTDNEALRYQVAELRRQSTYLLGLYISIAGAKDIAVATSLVILRVANANALKTVVTNQGSAALNLYEDTYLIAIVAPGESYTSPMTGQGEITADCATSTTAAIATYQTV